MAHIKILDTGYLKTDNTGTRLTASEMANDGSPITLKSVQFDFTRKDNIDTNPAVASYDDVDVFVGGFEAGSFQIKTSFDMDDSTDRQTLRYIVELSRTKGYKVLFYDDQSDTDQDAGSTLLFQISQIEGTRFTSSEVTEYGGISGTTVRYIPVHIESVNLSQKVTNRVTAKITCVKIKNHS